MLLWEHRGWILRMASLYKGQTVCRMQAIRHENLSVFLQTSDVRQLTSACFPLFTHRGINYPPATGWSPHSRPGCQFYGNRRFLNVMDLQPMTTRSCRHSPSLQRGKRAACFPFAELLNSCPYTREHSASLLQSTKIAPSRESVRILADL